MATEQSVPHPLRPPEEIAAYAERVFVDCMRPRLRRLVERLVREKHHPAWIMAAARKAAGHPRPGEKGYLTLLGVVALLHTLTGFEGGAT